MSAVAMVLPKMNDYLLSDLSKDTDIDSSRYRFITI